MFTLGTLFFSASHKGNKVNVYQKGNSKIRVWYIHITEYYTIIKNNKLMWTVDKGKSIITFIHLSKKICIYIKIEQKFLLVKFCF